MNVMDVLISLNVQQRPEPPLCHMWFGATGRGPAGGWGLIRGMGWFLLAMPGVLKGTIFYFSSFPEIMALDINDS